MKLADFYKEIWRANCVDEGAPLTIYQVHPIIHAAANVGLSEITLYSLADETVKQLENEGFEVTTGDYDYEYRIDWYDYEEE